MKKQAPIEEEFAQKVTLQTDPSPLKPHTLNLIVLGMAGSGKTTFASKLANYLQTKKGKKVMLVACDVYRPAANC